MNSLLLLSIRENSTFDFNYFSGGLPDLLCSNLISIFIGKAFYGCDNDYF
jgi:hypothetical protein